MSFAGTASLDVGTSVCFAAAYNNTGSRLAIGGEDCTIRVYHPDDKYKRSSVVLSAALTEHQELRMPIMALRFRPNDANNLLLAATCDGTISLWHLGTSKVLQSFKEESSLTYAADYDAAGHWLATGGSDGTVRVYDASHNNVLCSKHDEGPSAMHPKAHTSRIQSVRFKDAHTVLSGGWDRVVCLWDIRTKGRAVGTLEGPYLCGDGIAVSGHHVVCASSERTEDQLELFDLRSMARIKAVTLPAPSEGVQAPSLFAARFAPDESSSCVAVGGSNYCGMYSVSDSKLQALPITATPAPTSVFCAAWDPSGRSCFFGGRSGHVVTRSD